MFCARMCGIRPPAQHRCWLCVPRVGTKEREKKYACVHSFFFFLPFGRVLQVSRATDNSQTMACVFMYNTVSFAFPRRVTQLKVV